MLRKIITIDEEKCTGCGLCVPDCPEGALQIIEGKARLVGELLCDGLGACLGKCPEGALHIEEREAEEYDEYKVMENVVKGGDAVIAAHLKHLTEHGQKEYEKQAIAYLREKDIAIPDEEKKQAPLPCGCPGKFMQDFRDTPVEACSCNEESPSALRQWPVQLALLNPQAPYFKDAHIVVAADCVPFTYASFHARFLKGKTLAICCPKLDQGLQSYIEKMTEIIRDNSVQSLTVVRMEVPCCSGIVRIVEEALNRSGKTIDLEEVIISIRGDVV